MLDIFGLAIRLCTSDPHQVTLPRVVAEGTWSTRINSLSTDCRSLSYLSLLGGKHTLLSVIYIISNRYTVQMSPRPTFHNAGTGSLMIGGSF